MSSHHNQPTAASPDGDLHDSTRLWAAAVALLEGQRRVLEKIASGHALSEILNELVHLIESQSPETLCSILLLDADGVHVRNAAAPSLPAAFSQAIDGAAIGAQAGSCGTAMFRREAVFAEDILVDPLWNNYRELATAFGLRACWSTPIFDAQKRVLGTFAIYHRQPMLPGKSHLDLINVATHIAAIAIGRQREETALRTSEARLVAAQEQAKIGSWELDTATQTGTWSAELYRLFKRDPQRGAAPLEEFVELLHPDDRAELLRSYEETLRLGGIRSIEFRSNPDHGPVKHLIATSQSFKDAAGRIVLITGTIQDISERRNVEEALRLSESGYRLLRDSNIAGVIISDAFGAIHESNDAFLNMVGYTREELNAGLLRWDKMTPPEWQDVSLRIRAELLERGVCLPTEKEYHRKDGTRVPVLIRGSAFPHNRNQFAVFVMDLTERKLAEKARLEHEERYRALFDSSPIAICVHVDKIITHANPALCELLGAKSADELLGKNALEIVHPSCYELIRERWRVIQTETKTPAVEQKFRRRDGSTVDVEVNAVLVDAERNEIQVTARDITERKVNAALIEDERNFSKTVIDSLPGVFYLVNSEPRLIRWNKNFETVTGRSADELGTMNPVDLFPPDELHLIRANIVAVLRDGNASVEVSLLTSDGHAVPYYFTGLRVQIGQMKCMAGVGIDISERKQSEAALLASEDRYRRAIRGTSDGLWDWNIITGEHYHSPRWAELLGYLPTELFGRRDPFRDMLHPDDLLGLQAATEQHLKFRVPLDTEFRLRTKSGEYMWFRSRGQAEWNEEGRPVRMAGAITDITKQKLAEASLQESERRLRDAQSVAEIGDWRYNTITGEIKWSDVLFKLFERDVSKGPPSYEENMAYYFPESSQRLQDLVRRTMETGESFEGDFQLKLPSGREVYHHGIGRCVKDETGKVISLHGVSQDITKRKQAEEKLITSEGQLRGLVARLQRVQEEERIKVSRDLHDELGQLLTSLKMDVRWIERKLSDSDLPTALNPILDRAIMATEMTDATIAAVQKIAGELRPGALDQLGLAAALTQRARKFQERNGIACVVRVSESGPPLSPFIISELFYICQEALTNVTRHSQAQHVEIVLKTDSAVAILEVHDDGKGISANELTAINSLGLLGMQERARLCGGTINFENAQPHGTKVIVSVPRISVNTRSGVKNDV